MRKKKDLILGFDVSHIRGNKTGVEYYSLRLYDAMKQIADEWRIIPFSNHPIPEIPETVVVPSKLPLALWRQLILPKYLKKYGVTSFHSPMTAAPWFAPCPTIATVHDLSYRFAPGYSRKSRYSQIMNCTLSVLFCKKLAAVSDTTCQLLRKYYPRFQSEFYSVCSGALANPPCDSTADDVLIHVKAPYFLQLGRIEQRKDPLTTLCAFKESGLYKTHSLVFIGTQGNAMAAVTEWMQNTPEVAKKIIITGYLPENDVHSLLRNADALMYPSVDEGFGHPPFEALSVKTIPLVSDIAVFRELLQDAAVYAPVGDVTAFAAQLKKLAAGEIEKKAILCAGEKRLADLVWQKTAQGIWKLHTDMAL
ncbi:MAG: glycosyltransferase family 4 protein [Lentisphaeria bacterium]|nr:glycosyltransferase family 4 protein [Lentisphaeria bacterium]